MFPVEKFVDVALFGVFGSDPRPGRTLYIRHEAQQELETIEAELQEEIAAIGSENAASVSIETVQIKPKRGAVEVQLVALAWQPIAYQAPTP